MVDSAQRSPVYKWVKEWQLALPLHRLPLELIPRLPVFVATRNGAGPQSRVGVVRDAIAARMRVGEDHPAGD